MAIALVGSGSSTSFSTSTTLTYTSKAKSTLILAVLHQSTNVSSITDTGGNTWTRSCTSVAAGASGQYQLDYWYVFEANAITSLTATISASNCIAVTLSEWTGVGDVSQGAGAYYSSPSGTKPQRCGLTGYPTDVIVGAVAYLNSTNAATPSAGYSSFPGAGTGTTRMDSAWTTMTAEGVHEAPRWTLPSGTSAAASASVRLIGTPSAKTAGGGHQKIWASAKAVSTRPTGTDYVTLESLGQPSTGQGLKNALAMNGGGKILTLPEGDFIAPTTTWDTVKDAIWNVPSSWVGLVGSGKGTRITFPAGMVTPPGIPAQGTNQTNPYHTIQAIDGLNFREFGNLFLDGNAGHNHGGIRMRNEQSSVTAGSVKIYKVWMRDCAPGDSNTPPGETFGINAWHCAEDPGTTITITDVDADGLGNMSSAIGFNDCKSITVKRVNIRNAPYGMLTCWRCEDITYDGINSTGGDKGLNLEQVGGTIIIRNVTLQANRSLHPNAMHLTFQSNDPAFVADRLEVHDVVTDRGLREGCIMIMSSLNYPVGGGSSVQLQQWSAVHVYTRDANGVEYELGRQETWNSPAANNPTLWFYAYR